MNKTFGQFLMVALAIALVLAIVAIVAGPLLYSVSEGKRAAEFDSLMAESSPVVYDYQGNVTSMAWLQEEFGNVTWTQAPVWEDKDVAYRLIELRAQCDYATSKVCVVDENGNPLSGIAVVRSWAAPRYVDAPGLPDFSGITQQWTSTGVHGPTENGCIGFGMGGGDYYYVDRGESGVSAVYPADSNGPGDFLEGLGMLAGTNHCHVDSVFQRVSDASPPPPPPTPGPTPVSGDGWDIDITIKGSIDKK